ncbi:MAG: glutamate 5-kinase [Gammaproteobacteria bacterium]|nr:glutamate 5-kinase [Gammaproteobacteria bacterium]MDH5803075.1 glutamate 5-kinase [Gammaproteobacteria bacterium]
MSSRLEFKNKKRWVVKIGSSLLTAQGRGLDQQAITQWVEQVAHLHRQGMEVILVSSGAVAEGMMRLGWSERPRALFELQAAAAVGQMGLVQAYESRFQKHGIHTAQILLTHEDLSDRQRYLNARSTLLSLLRLKVVPVINENDTVTTEEIQFGDNDSLAALVANLVEAEALLLLTDQDGLYRQDPRVHPDAELIEQEHASEPALDQMVCGDPGKLGRGGMFTKVRAARLAARSGATTVIANGSTEAVIRKVLDGEALGTVLLPDKEPLAARKQWLAGHLQCRGRLVLDAGAVKVLRESGRSLLPVGVKKVEGQFRRGELVQCLDQQGREVARGLVNYAAVEAGKIVGQPSSAIESILGYVDEPELIHRDNLVLV